jgi:flagellar biosynthesis chaperone FliJ
MKMKIIAKHFAFLIEKSHTVFELEEETKEEQINDKFVNKIKMVTKIISKDTDIM